jgi:hypothetical protein
VKRTNLEQIAKTFGERIAKARDSRERNKIVGELLEYLVRSILREKGYTVYDHFVEKRTEPDVYGFNGHSFLMEIGNVKEFTKGGKPEFYAKKKIERSIINMKRYARGYKIDRKYFLVSHASALALGKERLEEDVEILQIGSQGLPENMLDIYPKLRDLLNKHFPKVKRKKTSANEPEIVILTDPQKPRYETEKVIEDDRNQK